MIWLKQSTARTLVIGPFLDSTDGVTPETGLTISQADIRLSKNGGAFAQTNNATGATHMENGYYSVPLDATDTNTLGVLRVAVAESGALPVWQDLMVVPANVWDSMFGADYLQVDAVQVEGSDATDQIRDAVIDDATRIDASALNTLSGHDPGEAIMGATDLGTGAGLTSLASAANLATVAGYIDTEVAAILADTNELQTDLADGGRLDLLVDAIKAKTDNIPAAPAATGDIPSAATIADAVWDEASTGHTDAGKAGAQVWTDIDAILEDTGTTLDGKVDTIDGNVDAILADTGTDGVQVAGIKAAALADLFDTDSGTTYAAAVAGSVVKEIADNAGGSALTAAGIADAVWDEAVADHSGVGSTGAALAAAGGSGDPWATALPGAYGAGTAGKIIGDNLNAPVGTVDTVVDAIKAKTDNLPASPAAVGSAMTLEAGAVTAAVIATDAIDGDAIAATAVSEIQSGLAAAADLATVDTVVDGIATTLGAAGAGLTAVPWNAAWDAEVQSEATDALNAYDPPTKAELDAGFAALNDLDAAGVRSAVGLAAANLDTQLDALPTATENADALLNRDMSAVSDTTARSPLNALRALRNKVAISGATMTVYEEDDATSAWTAAVATDAGADPITSVDPA